MKDKESHQDENRPAGAAEGSGALAPAHRAFVCLAIVSFVLFIAAVYCYAHFAAPFVDGLSSHVGEVVVQRAKDLAELGQVEAAMATYRKALDAPFDDPRQRGWALRGFGELLIRERRSSEAIPVLEECIEAYPDDLKAHGLLCEAFRQTQRYDDEQTAAVVWFRLATERQHGGDRAHAKYHMGTAWEAQGQPGKALDCFLEGHAIDPEGLNAFHAAKLLCEAKREDEAVKLLDLFIEHGSGWRLDSARNMRKHISG